MWDCDKALELLLKDFHSKMNDYIDMLYIQAMNGLFKEKSNVSLTKDHINDYLKKRGYIPNILSKKVIYTKGFVCAVLRVNNFFTWQQ